MARAAVPSDQVMVRVLGATEFTVGTRRIGMGTEALFALGLYLTTRAGDRVSRDDVLDTFWPGGEEEARRHAMRQMLYRLRQKGMSFLEDGDSLTLDPAKVDSDLRRCLAPSWPESATAEDVEGALAFGPTFSTRLPRAFLEWCDGIRDEVSHQARKAAMQLIVGARSQGRWADLDRWAKAVLRSDPLNEEATLARAEAASMSGSKTLALEILDCYLAEVGTGDGSVGKPALQLRKRIAERRASWVPTGPREVPLVGREEEMSALTQAVESALLGRSRSVLLVGPSGYGKSRLLAEAREYAALRGVRCVALRAEATLASHPWAFARQFARELSALPGAAATNPRSMETIRGLIREEPSAESSLSFGPATTPTDIQSSLLSLAQAVADETRLLVTLDNFHCSDDLSLDTVTAVLLALQNSRCTSIAAGQDSLLVRLSNQNRAPGLRTIALPPLSLPESESLARATAQAHGRDISNSELARIARRSEGHPLFARELALSNSRNTRRDGLPLSLAELVAQSLSAQPPSALKVLRIIALLSENATALRVRMVAELDKSELTATIDRLASSGIVHLDPSRKLRMHDAWREAVLASTPDATCTTLALECAQCLARDSESADASVNRRIAELYRIAGENDQQVLFLLRSIDDLLSAGLYDSALESIESLGSGATNAIARARIQLRRALCLLSTGRVADGLEVSEGVWRSRLLQSAEHLGEHTLAVCVSADCHIKLDSAPNGPARELLSAARNGGLSVQDRSRACLWGIRMVSNASHVAAFSEFASIARRLAEKDSASPHAALVTLIYAAETGTGTEIQDAHDRLSHVEYGRLSIGDRCLLLRCTAHALRIAGDLSEAAATVTSANQLATTYELGYAARLAAELACNLYLDFGMVPEAEKWFEILDGISGPRIASTKSAVDHTRDRLDYASGRFELLSERIEERLGIIDALCATHGKASELALAAAVRSHSGRDEEARSLVRAALQAIGPFIGRQAADFAIDTCLHAASSCGIHDEVKIIGEKHVLERAVRRQLKVAPGFLELAKIRND